jgi:ArsR family transcriptional regulator, arsenate/arsenite/antimonite-responsive transcriptional repressor
MSNQAGSPAETLPVVATTGGGCCAPLVTAPLAPEQAGGLARAFKALGDPVRLRLLSLITSAAGEICVCDLTGAFDLTGPTISHHLKVLREAGLIDCERRGTWVYYWPLPETLQRLSGLLATPGLAPAPAAPEPARAG